MQLLYYFPATGIHLLKCKGMVDGFRNLRPKVYEAQMVYSPIQVSNVLTVSSGQVSFPVQNLYSFTDLSYLTTAWKLEQGGLTIASGNTNASLPPRSAGTVQIAVPADALAYADTLQLDFIHPDGRDILAYQFAWTNTASGSQLNSTLPAGLPIPTLNLITRKTVTDPGYGWSEVLRYPASLTSVVLTPANATNLAQLQALSATVIGGTNGTQVLGQLQAGYTNNQFSYSLTMERQQLDGPGSWAGISRCPPIATIFPGTGRRAGRSIPLSASAAPAARRRPTRRMRITRGWTCRTTSISTRQNMIAIGRA